MGALVATFVALSIAPALAEAATSATIGGDQQAREAADSLTSVGILTGWDASQDVPQEYMTRGQLAIMLARALGLKDSNTEYFDDVPSSLDCFGAVGALEKVGLITGPTATTFAPDQSISRRWAVLWIMEALEYKSSQEPEGDVPVRLCFFESTNGWLAGLKDRPLVGASCARAVANAYRLGIIEPSADGWFYPTLPLSWGDAAIMLDRAFVRPPTARDTYPQPISAESEYSQRMLNSEGPLVWYVQYRLAELKYVPGEIDGVYARHTKDAVIAFQKVEGLRRTGVMTYSVFQRLTRAETPTPKKSDEGTRVEVDLTHQVLYMITDDQVWKIVHVSTGKSGTRTGHFSIGAKYKGYVECVTVNGTMYYPSYVVSRTAIHGYPSVPTYPASHGCIRVPMWTAEQLWYEMPSGTVVDVYYNR